ncbi:hypothetical protein ACUF6J_003075 [Enterobacter hormaechei]
MHMNTPGWMHPQLLAFDPLQADRRIVHFKWDTDWDILWATTRIPPLLVLDCMGYKADLSVSFNFLPNPASAGFLLSEGCRPGKRSAKRHQFSILRR